MPSQNSIKLSAVAIIGTATTLLLANLISKYGATGALRLIWEGDHLPPDIREAIDTLDEMEESEIPDIVAKIDKIQILIQTTLLNSVDTDSKSTTPSILQTKEILNEYLSPKSLSNLKKNLAMISHDLDRVAADIDSVQSYGNTDVKSQKKKIV